MHDVVHGTADTRCVHFLLCVRSGMTARSHIASISASRFLYLCTNDSKSLAPLTLGSGSLSDIDLFIVRSSVQLFIQIAFKSATVLDDSFGTR